MNNGKQSSCHARRATTKSYRLPAALCQSVRRQVQWSRLRHKRHARSPESCASPLETICPIVGDFSLAQAAPPSRSQCASFFMACLHLLYRPTMVSAAHPSDDCGKKASIYFTFVTFCFEASTAAPQPQLLLTVPTSMKLSIPVPLKPDICPKR